MGGFFRGGKSLNWAQNVNGGLHWGKAKFSRDLPAVVCPTVRVVLGIGPDSVLSPYHFFTLVSCFPFTGIALARGGKEA